VIDPDPVALLDGRLALFAAPPSPGAGYTVDDLLPEVLDQVLALMEADTAAVLLLDPSGRFLVATAARGLEAEVRQGARVAVGTGFAGRVAAQRRPVVVDEVSASTVVNPVLFTAGVRALVGVPLLAGDQLLGVLHVGARGERRFGPADAALLQAAADRVAPVLRSRAREADRAAAQALHRSLWPAALPAVPGLDLAARYVPAGTGGASGDWYDVLTVPTGAVWLVMGDVAGHGLPAAVAMGRLRSALRAYALETADPAELLRRLDRQVRHFDPGVMATVLCAVVDPTCGTMRLSSAGHPPPVVTVGTGPAATVEVPADLPLGVADDRPRRSASLLLTRGATVCFFTDGLVERRGRSLDDGLEVLRRTLHPGPAEAVCATVMAALVGEVAVDDDVAVLVARRTPDGGAPEDLELEAPAVPQSLQPLRHATRVWLADAGIGRDHAGDVLLAVGEAMANAVEHAYGPRRGTVSLRMWTDGTDVLAEVRDSGRWRAPRGRRERGRGLTLVTALCADVRIDRTDAGTTVVLRCAAPDRGAR
jgi:anti-sigma regulatory factor (Ser/Thr protein kinase)